MARKGHRDSAAKGKALVAELRVKYITDFLTLWQRFYALFEEGIRQAHVTEEQDAEFARVKSQIMQLVQLLYEAMPAQISFRNRTISILSDTPSMYFLHDESPVKVTDLRTQWNEVLIGATKVSGGLKDAVEE